jgi:hypothetical protein
MGELTCADAAAPAPPPLAWGPRRARGFAAPPAAGLGGEESGRRALAADTARLTGSAAGAPVSGDGDGRPRLPLPGAPLGGGVGLPVAAETAGAIATKPTLKLSLPKTAARPAGPAADRGAGDPALEPAALGDLEARKAGIGAGEPARDPSALPAGVGCAVAGAESPCRARKMCRGLAGGSTPPAPLAGDPEAATCFAADGRGFGCFGGCGGCSCGAAGLRAGDAGGVPWKERAAYLSIARPLTGRCRLGIGTAAEGAGAASTESSCCPCRCRSPSDPAGEVAPPASALERLRASRLRRSSISRLAASAAA